MASVNDPWGTPPPPRDAQLSSLDPDVIPMFVDFEDALRRELEQGDFEIVRSETRRSVERQGWLFASGRTRGGPILTVCDGVRMLSRHQDGRAVDYLIYRKRRVRGEGPIPDDHPAWDAIGRVAARFGFRWGGTFPKVDKPHVEVPKKPPVSNGPTP